MATDDLSVDSKNILAVAELNTRISGVVADAEKLQDIQCLGEISQVNEYDYECNDQKIREFPTLLTNLGAARKTDDGYVATNPTDRW